MNSLLLLHRRSLTCAALTQGCVTMLLGGGRFRVATPEAISALIDSLSDEADRDCGRGPIPSAVMLLVHWANWATSRRFQR